MGLAEVLNQFINTNNNNLRVQRLISKELEDVVAHLRFQISTGSISCNDLLFMDVVSRLVTKVGAGELNSWLTERPKQKLGIYIDGESYKSEDVSLELLPKSFVVYPYRVRESVIACVTDLIDIYIYYLILNSEISNLFMTIILESRYAYTVLHKFVSEYTTIADLSKIYTFRQYLISCGLILIAVRICTVHSLRHLLILFGLWLSQYIRNEYVEYNDQNEYRSYILSIGLQCIITFPGLYNDKDSPVSYGRWMITMLAMGVLQIVAMVGETFLELGYMIETEEYLILYNCGLATLLGILLLTFLSLSLSYNMSLGFWYNITFTLAKWAIHLAATELYVWLIEYNDDDRVNTSRRIDFHDMPESPRRVFTNRSCSSNIINLYASEVSEAAVFKAPDSSLSYSDYIQSLKNV